jgi:hypothetical protein
MLRRTAMICLTLALWSAPTPAPARDRPDEPLFPNGVPTVDEAASPDAGLRCATSAPANRPEIPSLATIRSLQAQGRVGAGGVIPVAFHIITDNKGVGDFPDAWLDAEIEVLNRTYGGRDYAGHRVPDAANTGYTFYKASVDRTRSKAWFKMLPGSNAEYMAKLKLGINTASTLNVYTAGPGYGLLGWATFPWWYSLPYGSIWDGVVVHWASMPGGPITNYNSGGTGVHEIGHWLGLFHTFQDGCAEQSEPGCFISGDGVCDTPSQAQPNFGCPEGIDTCPAEGLDPIHNYMNYTYDWCMNQFTPGQDARMDYMVATYRPAIGAARLAGPAARAGSALAARVAGQTSRAQVHVAPNPFNPLTKIILNAPADGAATLRVLDVSGRVVATLVDGTFLSRGPHEFTFDGRALASGVYVVSLRQAGTAAATARLVLIK